MTDSRSAAVSDSDARAVHAILKRVIHLLPPTMMTAMGTVALLVTYQLYATGLSFGAVAVAVVFFSQLVFVVSRLKRDIDGVDSVSSDADIEMVRDGLSALALLHHRGLLMTASTLIIQLIAV